MSSHATKEFEFHISPVPSSSRPHVSGGTRRRASSKASTVATSSVTRVGLSTASAMSGMTPPRQQRTSYRNQRKRPRGFAATGPSQTTPRFGVATFQTGPISITYRLPPWTISSAEW